MPELEDSDLSYTADPARTLRYNDINGVGTAAQTHGEATSIYHKHLTHGWSVWHPFANAADFELAKWFLEAGVTKTKTQEFLE
jgi:hypothetical protein